VLTLRLVLRTPGRYLFLWRTWTIAKYRIEIFRLEVGPGLHLPHPFMIVIADGTKLGSDVTIQSNVTIGFARAPRPGQVLPCPTVGDRVVIGAGSIVVGPITIGSDARLEPGALVTHDVAPGSVVKAQPA
jgi:serine O-acetyltransferase